MAKGAVSQQRPERPRGSREQSVPSVCLYDTAPTLHTIISLSTFIAAKHHIERMPHGEMEAFNPLVRKPNPNLGIHQGYRDPN